MGLVNPHDIARPFLQEVKAAVAELPPIHLVGFLATDRPDAASYSNYAARGCAKVGIGYEVRRVPAAGLSRYPLVRKRIALATRSGVRCRPSRSGSSPRRRIISATRSS